MKFWFLLLFPTLAAAHSSISEKREFPLNFEVSPCQNFYQHVCSKVQDSFTLREDRSFHDFAFHDSAERLLEAKKKFIKELKDKKNLSLRAQILKTIYQACMNKKASIKEERANVKMLIERVSQLKTHKEFQEFLKTALEEGDYSFLSFSTIASIENPDYEEVYFLGNIQTLPERSYYEKPEILKEFTKVAEKLFKEAGFKEAKKRARAVVQFEKTFVQNFPLPHELRVLFVQPNAVSQASFLKKYPNFKLEGFFKRLPKDVKVREFTPDNYAHLNKALEVTPLAILKDVYLFHALSSYMDDAYPDFYKTWFDFAHKYLGGPLKRPEREERCTKEIMADFGMELDSEMVPLLFPDFPQERVITLAENVRSSILKGLEANPWLSANGKKAATKKIKHARLQLVIPQREEDWNFTPPALYSEETPYENSKILAKNLLNKTINELYGPRNKSRWDMPPLTVNAYYDPTNNKFVLPIGILQPPFYDPVLSDQANLGGVGAVIGHELGHAIDDQGAHFDEVGRLKPWMPEEDLKVFKIKTAPLIAQFTQAGHNGDLTLGENIGDLVGLTFAYQAAFPKNEGGLEAKKNFFYQYARLWCEVMRPAYRENRLKTDPHSLGEARVNEQVKHQAAFSEVFQCQAEDPMTLPQAQQVRVW